MNEHFDAASGARLSSDESCQFEREHHLVNRRWADAKIFLHIGFGWRPAVQACVKVDKRQILALLGREIFCSAAHARHPIQLFVRASNEGGGTDECTLSGRTQPNRAHRTRCASEKRQARGAGSNERRFCWPPTRGPATTTSRPAWALAARPSTGPSSASWKAIWNGR